ncbi:MAG: AN1-type zinc finger domain-containing protein, partial [Candidatus Heimdallarchaeota archaeon]
MTFCEQCGVEIGYLPFKCKYCGGTFCKKHRLPENHQCTFELKHTPVVPKSSREYSARTIAKPVSQEYLSKGPRELKKYLKRQEKQKRRTIKSYDRSSFGTVRYKGTKIIILMVMTFSIAALFFEYYGIPKFIFLSLNGLIFNFTFHTLLTSLFIAETSIIWIFFLIIMMYFLYMIARNIELTYGTSFLIKL